MSIPWSGFRVRFQKTEYKYITGVGKVNKRKVGAEYEQLASDYLVDHEYTVVERNLTTPYGEIDIIAENKNYIVFVEVKTRHKDSMTSAADAVNRQKQIRIIKTASLYLAENETEKFCRFDVCEVYVNSDNLKLVDINYIEAAFE